MADPDVDRIYNILKGLAECGIERVPLILGKETLVDPSLGPAIERIARDPARRLKVRSSLPLLARKLLDQVEATGRVRMDRWAVATKQARQARLVLQRELLAMSFGLHTERGYHTSVVVPWQETEFSKRFAKKAAGLTLEKAADELLLAAVRSAVVAPEREVGSWLAFGFHRVALLVAAGELERLIVGPAAWLARSQ
jgi:hypothetical protein